MEDDKLKSLFADFDPEMQSDDLFMDRLRRNLNAIESVREHSLELKRHNRLAVAVAAITGFISGVVFTLCYPYLASLTNDIIAGSTTFSLLTPDNMQIILYILICLAITVLSYSAYDITLIATKNRIVKTNPIL